MSWQERIKDSVFKIKTGDGEEWFPLLKGPSKSREYNATSFDFIDVEGTYIDRKKPKSAKIDLVFYFQGDNHIEISENFEISAADSRYWVVDHPVYGTLNGQPLSLTRNDNYLGSTEITVDFWETILEKNPKKQKALLDIVAIKQEFLNFGAGITIEKNRLTPAFQNVVKSNVKQISLRYDKLLNDVSYPEYLQKYSTAMASVDKMLTDPAQCIRDINKLLDAPSYLEKSVRFRFRIMNEVYNDIKQTLLRFGGKNMKTYFQATGAGLISSAAQVTLRPQETDYISRRDVEDMARNLDNLYNDYLQTLDSLQSPIEDLDNAFLLDYTTQESLNTIVKETLYGLFDIAFNSKQERQVEIEKNSNLIVLCHKYLGLDENDENIEKFRSLNNIKNKNVFGVKKGTVIKYLV